MHTVLVGLDGSPAGDDARHWAESMAAAVGARVETVELDGRPGPVLLDTAELMGADLVVVACPPEAAARLLDESPCDYLAHHARRPFAVVPAGASSTPPRRIAVALDGSAGAEQAAAWTAQVAPDLGAAVVAVEVLELPPFLDRSRPEIHAMVAGEMDATWTAPLAAAGLAVTSVVVEGTDPTLALLAVVADEGADALVLGARHLHGVRLVRSHGVTMTALHRGGVPVITVPTDHGLATPLSAPERAGAFVEP